MITNGLRLAGMMATLYATRRYYRNWGTTKEECQMFLDGDDLIAGPVLRSTEAVSIDGQPGAVWPWLVQIGQDRGGLYTFEKLENAAGLRYVNADRIHPEWQHLAQGDTIRLVPKGWMGLRADIVLEVVEVADQQSIVLRAFSNREWNVVWSFHVIPHWEDRCRLLIRIRTPLRHPGQALITELAGPGIALVTRGILLGIKRRVQQQVQAEASAAKASGDLHRVV
jgi:hypothetical protein